MRTPRTTLARHLPLSLLTLVLPAAAACGPAEPDTAGVSEAIETGGEPMPEEGPKDEGEGSSGGGIDTGGEPMPDEGPKDDGSAGSGCRWVYNASQLLQALRERHQGWVCVPDGMEIDMTRCRDVKIYPGTRLWGGRSGTRLGARLFTRAEEDSDPEDDLEDCTCPDEDCAWNPHAECSCDPDDHNYPIFRLTDDSDEPTGVQTRIEGFRLHGPYVSHQDGPNSLNGIEIDTRKSRNVVIAGNEISGFSMAGVRVLGPVPNGAIYPEQCDYELPVDPGKYNCGTRMTAVEATDVTITRNYIHHNIRDGLGYGVAVGNGAYAYISGNVFDYNRHAVSHDGSPYSGYFARHNYVLQGGHCEDDWWGCYYNQHFDVHGSELDGDGGIGGEYFEVAGNTIRGDQKNDVGADPTGAFGSIRPALKVRGEPTNAAVFTDNVLEHEADDAVETSDGGVVDVGPNRYEVDTTHDLAVGDFDGDGKDDVFIATGTAWFYSSAGKTEWRFLKATSLPIDRLGFGKFDDDNRTDVFWRRESDGAWFFVSGGQALSEQINVSGVPFEQYRFGDFDGDGYTDVFRANGSEWKVSWRGRGVWTAINQSVVGIDLLRFGDFDGDGITDVFNIHPDGYWRWSRSGQGLWTRLNYNSMSTNLDSLAFGNFDGKDGDSDIDNADRTTDVAQSDDGGWHYSRDGRSAWIALRGSGGQLGYADPTRCLVGDFDGDGRDDCIRYEQVLGLTGYRSARLFWRWTRGSDEFVRYSRHPMR